MRRVNLGGLYGATALLACWAPSAADEPWAGLSTHTEGRFDPERKESSLGYPCKWADFRHLLPPTWDECPKHKMVFLHTPKTGGESVEYAFQLELEKSHDMAKDIAATMTPEEWECAFKFSTARNPWGRWESWYSFCVSGYGDPPQLPTPAWACTLARSTTLPEFTKQMIAILSEIRKLPAGMADHVMEMGETYETAFWFEPQWAYVTDTSDLGKMVPNFVIAFEALEDDFACLASLLGVRIRLPHKNVSTVTKDVPVEERVKAFDEEAIRLVREYNSFEVNQYGYEFPQ